MCPCLWSSNKLVSNIKTLNLTNPNLLPHHEMSESNKNNSHFGKIVLIQTSKITVTIISSVIFCRPTSIGAAHTLDQTSLATLNPDRPLVHVFIVSLLLYFKMN